MQRAGAQPGASPRPRYAPHLAHRRVPEQPRAVHRRAEQAQVGEQQQGALLRRGRAAQERLGRVLAAPHQLRQVRRVQG